MGLDSVDIYQMHFPLLPVNIDHGGVRLAQLIKPGKSLFINFPGQGQALVSGQGQADQFFQPGCSRRFQVHPGVKSC